MYIINEKKMLPLVILQCLSKVLMWRHRAVQNRNLLRLTAKTNTSKIHLPFHEILKFICLVGIPFCMLIASFSSVLFTNEFVDKNASAIQVGLLNLIGRG